MNVLRAFQKLCKNTRIDYHTVTSVKPYNDSTFFCPAGMQQFTEYFEKKWLRGTCANVQPCLRVGDVEEMVKDKHLYFNMLGLFSFREMTMKNAVDWWISFLEEYLDLKIDYITIHPKRLREWLPLIDEYIEVRTDNDCKWSDGNTSGYCIEFYIDGVEVGNIVNTEGDCIDAGFGLERLDSICNHIEYDEKEILSSTIYKIIAIGVKPSPSKAGYVLRKLLNIAVKKEIIIDHQYYKDEIERIEKMQKFYQDNKSKHKGKSKEWWKETHGVDLVDL